MRYARNCFELEPYVALVKSALDHDRSFESALRLGLKGVLCSPEFLFLDEPGRADGEAMTDAGVVEPVDAGDVGVGLGGVRQ